MWHMNENRQHRLGHSRSLCRDPRPAPPPGDEFYPILDSYIIDTGKGDNSCDNNVLRRSCFRAVERFALARPDLRPRPGAPLQAGLRDEDPVCREIAREALGKISCFRGAGGEWELRGGKPFWRKVSSSDLLLPSKDFSTLSNPLAGCSDGKELPFVVEAFYT